jgi:hypothetical protein
MRHSFTRVCYALAAVVAVTTTLGLSAASAASASTHTVKPNATPSCGDTCSNLFSERFGFSLVMTSLHKSGAIGNRLVLQQGSNSNVGQDFVITDNGPVSTFCADWPDPGSLNPLSYACVTYGDVGSGFDILEANYSPAGTPTDVCAGLATNAHANENVTLQTCGQPRTEWIIDANNFTDDFFGFTVTPWINASDFPSSHPEVLSTSTRGATPHHLLKVKPEHIFSDGTVNDGQEFGDFVGPLF